MKRTRLALVLLSSTFLLIATPGCPEGAGVCGDGVVDDGEACDDGNTTPGDGCSATCTTEGGPECGNGVVEAPETCDDGNTTPGDGCSATCTTEVVGPECGNGVREAGEACDDGNRLPGDGCEPDCTETNAQVTCGTIPPIASGTCEVVSGGAKILITANLLGPDGILEGGQLLIDESGQIACVDCDCSAQAAGATEIICPEGVVSPGLINSHDHLGWIHNDPYTIGRDERYEHRHDWRNEGERGHTPIPTSGGATTAEVRWGELRFLMGGATSTVGSGGATGFLRNLDKSMQEGLNQMPVNYQTFPLGDGDGTQLESGCGYPGRDTAASIAGDDAYFPHVSEGIDLVARNEFLCTSSEEGGGEDLAAPHSAFIHSIGLTPVDYALMAEEGTALIWSPRSNVTLYGDTAHVTVAARVGVRIALGTDWMPTGSMNMQRELKCADYLNTNYYAGFFSDRELWRMATSYGAEVAAVDDATGSLRPGLVADLAIFDGSSRGGYRAVIDAQAPDTVLVLRGGEPIYGDAAVVAALTQGCDPLDVCGSAKRVCTQDEIQMSFDALRVAAGAGIYPLFFCGEPENEPSCHPMRNSTVNGSTLYTGQATAADRDGDGIPDASDNCPDHFNPIRPVDNGVQGDQDADGVGDVCDPCPRDANTQTCPVPDPNDLDKDGFPLGSDNCPGVANPDQADADGDGKGDLCDPCPDQANPGSQACAVSIYAIKSGQATGTVGVTNAIVTACAPRNGFFVQVKPGDADYAGVENSGVFVYQGGGTACGSVINVGDRVDINPATVTLWWGQIELTRPTVVVRASGEEPPAPHVTTPAEASGVVANGLEGVLVQVSAVEVTSVTPAPGAGDTAPTNEFVVDDALRVDDLMYLIDPFPSVGATYTALVGVLAYRNGNQKLLLRDAEDVLSGPPGLSSLAPATGFVRVGAPGPTLGEPLSVVLTSPAQGDVVVAVTSSDPTSLTVVGDSVTVPDGARSAVVLLEGLVPAASVTLTASYDGVDRTATVQVLAADAQPQAVTLAPATAALGVGQTASFTVGIDLPANLGGATIDLAATGLDLSVPATVTIPQDQRSASFDVTAGAQSGTATLTATLGLSNATAEVTVTEATGGLVLNEVDYDQPGADNDEFIELYNAGQPIDLAGHALVLVNGSGGAVYETFELGAAGILGTGEFLVMGSATAIAGLTCKTLAFPKAADNVQNGAPDGIALIHRTDGVLLDALSYEGSMTAVSITGVGTVSLVEGTALPTGVADRNDVPGALVRIPDGADTDEAATDWVFTATPTPCASNVP